MRHHPLHAVLAFLLASSLANAQSQVNAWGDNQYGQCNVPALPAGTTYTSIAGGHEHSLAIRSDGALVAWGSNNSGQCNVPALPVGTTYTQVGSSVLWFASTALRSDGQIVAWGDNAYGQCDVPPLPIGTSYLHVDGVSTHSVAVRSDGACVAWGRSDFGQCAVPPLPPGVTYVEAVGANSYTIARRSDGSAVGWGRNDFGQCDVPALPPGRSYVQLADGNSHCLALRDDGAVVAWGHNGHGQCDVPVLPSGVVYTRIAAGGYHNVALRSDGVLVAWGDNFYGEGNVPILPPGQTFAEIAAGAWHTLARIESIHEPICFGDGPTNGGPDCPCSNNVAVGVARGCTNSTGNGGKLVATGNASLSADTVTLTGSDMAPASFSLFLQSPSTAGGGYGQVQFFDGLRCVGPSFVRLTTKMSVAGAAAIGAPSTSLSILGGIASPGTQYYQVVYRNNAGLCNFLANSTNGVAVVWGP